MGINMGALVKLPVIDLFGRPVEVIPLMGGAYIARGYFGTNALDEVLEDGSVLTSQQTYLDVLEAEFAVMPRQGDIIDIPADGAVPAAGRFEVVSATTDGGGLTTIVLNRVMASRP
jgi:hypothetical protein